MKFTLIIVTLSLLLTACSRPSTKSSESLAWPRTKAAMTVLDTKDIQPSSVSLLTKPSDPLQNLAFSYVGKTSAEIKAIANSAYEFQIVKNGVVVAQTDKGCAILTDQWTHPDSPHNVGLVLLFSDYDQAKLAEKTLRGE